MEKEKIQRINELKRISTERELTEEEFAERDLLRKEYIAGFRKNMEEVLNGVQIKEPDGTIHHLAKKKNP